MGRYEIFKPVQQKQGVITEILEDIITHFLLNYMLNKMKKIYIHYFQCCRHMNADIFIKSVICSFVHN